jgi:UDP-N-acetylglucosamine 1-carboxyvinyltransferase
MFENRPFCVDKPVSMGARIILCEIRTAPCIEGPAKPAGQRMSSPDIR